MKTKKLGYSSRCLFDTPRLVETLEKMALKGWKCKKFGYIFTHYEKIEPQALKYEVIFLPSISFIDGAPTQNQETLIEMCEESGWEYICQWGNAMVFCSSEENPTPIETDEALKLENIHKSMKKDALPSQYAMIFLFPFAGFLQTANIQKSPEYFYGGIRIFASFSSIICAVLMLLITGHYFHWYKKSKKAVEQGESCIKPLNINWIIYTLSAAILLLLLLAVQSVLDSWMIVALLIPFIYVVIFFGLIIFLRKQTFSTKRKKMIYWGTCLITPVIVVGVGSYYILNAVLSEDGSLPSQTNLEFPLEIQDIRPDDDAEYHKRYWGGGTFLLDWARYSLYNEESDYNMEYYLYQTDFDYISEKIVNAKLYTDDLQIELGLSWEKIYENGDIVVWEAIENHTAINVYHIQCGKNLMTITFGDGFTEAEKVEAVEILLLEIR